MEQLQQKEKVNPFEAENQRPSRNFKEQQMKSTLVTCKHGVLERTEAPFRHEPEPDEFLLFAQTSPNVISITAVVPIALFVRS